MKSLKIARNDFEGYLIMAETDEERRALKLSAEMLKNEEEIAECMQAILDELEREDNNGKTNL